MADPEEPLRIRAPAKVQRGQEGDGEQWELRDVRLEPGAIVLMADPNESSSERPTLLAIEATTQATPVRLDEPHGLALHVEWAGPESSHLYVKMGGEQLRVWLKRLREEIALSSKTTDSTSPATTTLSEGQSSRFVSFFRTLRDGCFTDDDLEEVEAEETAVASETQFVPSKIGVPRMNIVILVVGTRGDVQPFIYLGQQLLRENHRVRLATHAEYREDVVARGGLEFYPFAGDPKKLSEYMVKTAGRLMPDLLSREERAELPEKMKMLADICFSCHPACTAADPQAPAADPFLADAIISNPVAYGHIHCAEALSIPLHIMFPQPWSPTRTFPHPLANLSYTSSWSARNYYSYALMDEFMWLGLGGMMNRFRTTVLHLEPIRPGERGDRLLRDNKVPISHMWSPAFVPRCRDWPAHVDVVGEFRPESEVSSTFQPHPTLAAFLAGGERPVFIGFGSMVIQDPSRLVEMVVSAAERTETRVLLQSGWTKYAEDFALLSSLVMVVGAMPHDWLFTQVRAVVHHGGAGTTSAGLRAGHPTLICPFFGDQHFWAAMVHSAGAGPRGCRIQDLSVDVLASAFTTLRLPEVVDRAKTLGAAMEKEQGVLTAVGSFYRNLPLANMICEVSVFAHQTSRLASVYCCNCALKMCVAADRVVHRAGGGREGHVRAPFRPERLGVVRPSGLATGLAQGLSAGAYEAAGGVYDLFAKPVQGGIRGGLVGAAGGLASGVTNLFARPLRGGKILLEKVLRGAKGDEVDDSESGLNADGYVESTESIGAEALSDGDRNIETAYVKAAKVMRIWRQIDTDGNRCVDEKEMTAFLRSKLTDSAVRVSSSLFDAVDSNGDRMLTFAEFAWAMADEETSLEELFSVV